MPRLLVTWRGSFLALAEKQRHTMPVLVGHRLAGSALLYTGDFTGALAQYERGLALYDPAEHRQLAARFGQDSRVTSLYHRSLALWILGYPAQAFVAMDRATKDAREIGQVATLMPTLCYAGIHFLFCGDYAAASRLVDELSALAKEKGSSVLADYCDGAARRCICFDRQTLERDRDVRLRNSRCSGSGSNAHIAMVSFPMGICVRSG